MKKIVRIAQIAPINISVPPPKYGGTELIISLLTEELVKRGHEVTLYATGDSKTSARLKSYYPEAVGFGNDTPEMHMAAAAFAFKDAEEYDIIHNHYALWGLRASKTIKVPLLTTLHNDYLVPGKKDFDELRNKGHYNAVSRNQMGRLKGLNFAGFAYNAIEVEKYSLEEKKEEYLLFFGNLIKEKGVDTAVKAAQELKMKLIMSGKVIPGDQKIFFEKNIAPHINQENIVLCPLAEPQAKLKLLAKAKCLLFPIFWNEPFGLAMIEAMACGTPVVAFGRGSVPEVVKDGVTGYVVDTYSELLEAVRKVGEIDPKACRQHVEKSFTVAKMVDKYESIYRKILSGR